MNTFQQFLARANIEDDLNLILSRNRGLPLNCNDLAGMLESYWFRGGRGPAHSQDMILTVEDFVDLMVKVAHICVSLTFRRVGRLDFIGDRLNKPLLTKFYYRS